MEQVGKPPATVRAYIDNIHTSKVTNKCALKTTYYKKNILKL